MRFQHLAFLRYVYDLLFIFHVILRLHFGISLGNVLGSVLKVLEVNKLTMRKLALEKVGLEKARLGKDVPGRWPGRG